MDDLPHDPTAGHSGFERTLPDNAVEYLLFMIPDDASSSSNVLLQLEKLRRSALGLVKNATKDYMWQRDEFNLELKNEGGLVYLHGITEYGDAVEDEWLIVHILRTLSTSNPDLWVRVFDSDGEFLLVEAANVLPKWLSPEIDQNRDWIHDGQLLIVPCESEDSRFLTLKAAVDFIKVNRKELIHSSFVEAEAFYRLEKYPGQIKESTHRSLITIPRRLAYIVHSLPKSVAPAVEAFYLRDALTIKPVLSSTAELMFPPEDFVTTSVRFSKVLYAQLRSQRFETPPQWRSALPQSFPVKPESRGGDENSRRLEAGMKLTCGFEILAAKAESSKSRTVRELGLLVDDMREDGDEVLPSDTDIKNWPEAERNDSESWLDINYEDFERELSGRQNATRSAPGRSTGFGDAQAQDNLKKIVSRFESFLNDETAGLNGAEMDEMDNDDDSDDSEEEDSEQEDKEVSFNEDEFARLMKEMMGFPLDAKPRNSADRLPAGKNESADENMEEHQKIQQLSSQFEVELKKHGALRLDPSGNQQAELDSKANASESDRKGKQAQSNNAGDEISDDEVDIDYNLAKNLLESFKSQGGMSGPTGNMLSMMGLNLPRDEDGGRDDSK